MVPQLLLNTAQVATFALVVYLLDPYIIGVRENYRRAEKFLEVAIGNKGLMMTKALNNHIKMC